MWNQFRQVEARAVSSLIPYANNARTHSDAQVAQIAASIKEWGWTNPVLVDTGGRIIAGHGRVLAAIKLGMTEVPCIAIDGLTETQIKALIIADNKLALNAGWDEELLSLELVALDEAGYDLALTGFDDVEIDALIGDDEQQSEQRDLSAEPEVEDVAVTRLGDVWVMGRHRLLCGDSTNQDHLQTLLSGASPDVVVFDPPYEVEELYSTAMPVAGPGKKLVVFWDFKRFAIAGKSAIDAGWTPQYELVWDCVTSWYTPNRPLARHKSCGVFGDDPYWNFDAAIINDGKNREAKTVYNTRGECDYVPLDGAVHMRTVEAFPTTAESGGHAHSKPMAWIAALFNGIGGNVYLDLFGGSGSTLIACEDSGRVSYTMELEPRFCDVIIRRWQEFTGHNAVLESTGKSFADVASNAEV